METTEIKPCYIPVDKCARIIDELLSRGESVSTQDIYDKLEEIYGWVAQNYPSALKDPAYYISRCSQGYVNAYREGVRKIATELKKRDQADMLEIKDFPKDKRKKVYRYKMKGFSIFDLPKKEQDEDSRISRFTDSINKLLHGGYSMQIDRGFEVKFPKDIDKTFDILTELLEKARNSGIENTFYGHIENIERLRATRPDNWVQQCFELLLQVKEEYSKRLSSIAYADLLIEIAEFISSYNIPIEQLSRITDGNVLEYAQSLYLSAISRAAEEDDIEKEFIYLIEYGEFLCSNSLYTALEAVCDRAFKLHSRVEHADKQARMFHLMGNYNLHIKNLSMAEECYRTAYQIRLQMTELSESELDNIKKVKSTSPKSLEKNIGKRPGYDAFSDFAKTADALGSLYKTQMDDCQAQSYYESAFKIREVNSKRNSRLFCSEYVLSLYNLANLYKRQGNRMRASRYLNLALGLIEKNTLENHGVYSDTCICIDLMLLQADLYNEVFNYKKAEKFLEKASALASTMAQCLPRKFDEYDAEITLAFSFIHFAQHNYPQAAKEAEAALALYKRLSATQPDRFDSCIKATLYQLASCSRACNQYDKAAEYSEQAFIYSQKLYFKNRQAYLLQYIASLRSSAFFESDIHEQMRVLEKLKAAYDEMTAIAQQISSSPAPLLLRTKREIACLCDYLRIDLEFTKKLYQELTEEYMHMYLETKDPAYLHEYANCCKALSQCLDQTSESETYEELLRNAIQSYDKLEDGDPTSEFESAQANLLYALHLSLNERFSEAFMYYDKALSIFNSLNMDNPQLVCEYLNLTLRYYKLAQELCAKTSKI